jgi:hypothetical protein
MSFHAIDVAIWEVLLSGSGSTTETALFSPVNALEQLQRFVQEISQYR